MSDLQAAPIPIDAKYVGRAPGVPGMSRVFTWRGCSVIVSRDGGRWHMSIARPDRHPGWDEIRDARYAFLPDDVLCGIMLPPKGAYVNVHEHAFHVWEVDDDFPEFWPERKR